LKTDNLVLASGSLRSVAPRQSLYLQIPLQIQTAKSDAGLKLPRHSVQVSNFIKVEVVGLSDGILLKNHIQRQEENGCF
jgi:hypothetical protein